MTRPQAIDKIRKLRDLADGAGTEKEASSAAAMAFRLKSQFKISESEIVGEGARVEPPPPRPPSANGSKGRPAAHKNPRRYRLTPEQEALMEMAESGVKEMERAWRINGLLRALRPVLRRSLCS